jgi:hypothetical protein
MATPPIAEIKVKTFVKILIFLTKNPSKDQKAISPKAYLDIMHIGQASNPR